MTINAPAAWLLSLYIAAAERRGVARDEAVRHDAERHHQGIPVARHLHLPAGAVDAADRRRRLLHLQGSAEVEPDQRLLLPPAGGGGDAGAGTGLRAGQRRSPCSTRCKASGQVPADDFPQVVGPHQLLLQRRHPLHHRAVQDAGVQRSVGRDLPAALRRRGPEAAALPLRRAGQLAGADRAAAGEQRLPHPPGDAGGRAVEGRARPRRAAAGVERGAGPAAAVGPAVVAAPAADRRLRDRPARLRRHLRRLAGDRREGRAAQATRRARNWRRIDEMGGAVDRRRVRAT